MKNLSIAVLTWAVFTLLSHGIFGDWVTPSIWSLGPATVFFISLCAAKSVAKQRKDATRL